MEFPDVSRITGGDIIWKCWQKEYTTIVEVSDDLKELCTRQGLELLGEDDIVLDPSVSQLKGYDMFEE